MKTLLRLLLNLLFTVKTIGQERLLRAESTIIMPNYVSFLDALLLYAYLPFDACYVIDSRLAGRISLILKFVDHIVSSPLNSYSLINQPAKRKGEKILLYTPDQKATKQALRERMQQNWHRLALPSELITIDALPLLGSGKTDYFRLKELAAREASAYA